MYKFNVSTKLSEEGEDKHYSVQTCAISLRGQDKPLNEDFVFHRASYNPDVPPIALLVVCDGMGGYQMGSFASELATHIVTSELGKLFPYRDYFYAHTEQPTIPKASQLQAWMMETIQEANRLIFDYARNQQEIIHSGTRLTVALIHNQTAHIAHVGDTRAYLWRRYDLKQITEDHSYAAELEKGGILNKEEVIQHPYRKILSRSIGTQPEVKPEIYTLTLWPGDKLLICSDGIWAAFDSSDDMLGIMENDVPPSQLCSMLVDEARLRNNRDDMSVAMACIALQNKGNKENNNDENWK